MKLAYMIISKACLERKSFNYIGSKTYSYCEEYFLRTFPMMIDACSEIFLCLLRISGLFKISKRL